MTKLFITGATGYIGGDALYAIANAHPELEITALVRNSDKGAKVASQYSKIRLVYGDLDSTDILTTEASKANVVLHCADADHEGAAKALVAGLGKRESGKAGYMIHTSGTGILSVADFGRKSYGVKNEKVYNDWDGVTEVTSLPDMAAHRNVDKIVLAAGTEHPNKVHSVIVCPPCIWGPGRGPDNQKSVQVYRMARATLERGKGFQVEEGNNLWTEVHVQDLSNVYLSLVEDAIQGGKRASWGPEGYYFAENGDFVWGDVGRAIAKIAYDKKLIKTAEIDNISTEEADKLTPFGAYLWGMNSRARAIRARKLFDWKPKQKSLFEMLPDIVDGEARELGLTTSHAIQAAG
ncbi:NAD dependent epimerase/dehydratase family protein [Lindgomyces ingoldianus]|uniref:NAD dependent epimerase/dehydratase family protein n=1 Tax=Lindgomyces ingoldianus TaxID=673940 RepID=A0ACB6QBI2_9PLEO|nr:NAD dependent epimerase/dehydratase family protein [Lindgomyces ingoldianus]KAF2463737.1 NAD dependent epimerase/dehydratase family protein [Lindgomyces ingoldianus]